MANIPCREYKRKEAHPTIQPSKPFNVANGASANATAHATIPATIPATIKDILALFEEWYQQAQASEPNNPEAMALTTVDDQARPSLRMVLLKSYDQRGFTFYTNSTSRKGKQLAANRQAALLFYWKSLRRQIRIEGAVRAVRAEEADLYFASRPRGSQVGAWASDQSQPLESRTVLEERMATQAAHFKGKDVPRPPHWQGFRLEPAYFEYWQDRRSRLHERRIYSRTASGGWTQGWLYP